jgi:hypothetical protein
VLGNLIAFVADGAVTFLRALTSKGAS